MRLRSAATKQRRCPPFFCTCIPWDTCISLKARRARRVKDAWRAPKSRSYRRLRRATGCIALLEGIYRLHWSPMSLTWRRSSTRYHFLAEPWPWHVNGTSRRVDFRWQISLTSCKSIYDIRHQVINKTLLSRNRNIFLIIIYNNLHAWRFNPIPKCWTDKCKFRSKVFFKYRGKKLTVLLPTIHAVIKYTFIYLYLFINHNMIDI